ncbi:MULTISPECIES: hypothetical protein [unclassified Pantoea]|uniref:hypothetical protein n=1 Tax=unclassified Pantoea TaxID=2630326 RepID=UPI001232D913|nr:MULTISPECIES: hypothetical protein [unclassified Pantoea]KAA5932333.1 hypothetical protein F3I59_04710 [Pantoea sp. VH_8]KAA5937394.1 hypothetical protein F3I58_04740 [Pantoea sp. VH_4]
MKIIKRAWLWLITKKESEVSEPIADTTVVTADPTTVTGDTANVAATPAAQVKVGVQDFEAALAFVENGVAQLGAAAKDDLKALAKKYL